ncbi:acylpyruvase [Thermoplasmatales archaeon ex4572_165]|nr:MAG: acylpyruvase [Thermoplasmatales archaeon ex4572_165]RLF59187.1 MAG: acylpyruvase [Thermoplasmata archaeon]
MRYYQWNSKRNEKIQIGKIICLARTYKKHAKEMSVNIPIDPLIFLKPTSSIIFSGGSIIYPPQSHCLNHEVELGIIIGVDGKNISKEHVWEHIEGYCIGLDITARDIQTNAKKNGLPWTIAKGFDTFAPISEMIGKELIKDPHNVNLLLKVNGEIRQHDNTSNMVWTIPELISYISSIMALEKGDLILTGTPSGVNEIKKGDILEATMDSYCSLHVDVI